MTVKNKINIRTYNSSIPHSMPLLLLLVAMLFITCNKENGTVSVEEGKAVWISMHIVTPERRALSKTKSTTLVDPQVTPAPDEDGIGKENEIRTVRLFVFERTGGFVANVVNSDPVNETITTSSGSQYFAKLLFKLDAPKGEYKMVLVANEEMLNSDSRRALHSFQGSYTALLNHSAFLSIPLHSEAIANSLIAFTAETPVFDLNDASKYTTIDGRECYQVSTQTNPTEFQRICAKVELTITNQTEAGEFIKPASALLKVNTLRRIDIRNTTSLFPVTTTHPESVLSSEILLAGGSLQGNNEIGQKFTYTEQFYAGEYTEGLGFGTGNVDNTNTARRTSSAYFLQLKDINGEVYDYIIPIGDARRDASNNLIGMEMERNVIYRLKVNIVGNVGKRIEVEFVFRVASEKIEELDPVDIYPQN